MRVKRQFWRHSWLAAVVAVTAPVPAQDPRPPRRPPPLDETEAAARALEKLLGKGVQRVDESNRAELLPQGPPPRAVTEAQGVGPPGVGGPPPYGPPAAGPRGAPPQDPRAPPRAEPLREPEAAAEALRQLLPQAQPVTERPTEPLRPTGDPPPGPAIPPPLPPREVPAGAAAAPAPPALGVRGTLSLRYLGRWADDRDQDLRGVLAFDVGEADAHPLTFHFVGRGQLDLDGRQQANGFNGLEESFGRAQTGRIYDAYLDVHAVEGLGIARLGRQSIYDTPELAFFDGVRVQSEELGTLRAWVGGYGGVPVHLFEASARGDWLGGVCAGARPWRGGRVRLDGMYARDRTTGGTLDDDLWAVSVWQSMSDAVSLHGSHSWLGGAARDLRLTLDAAASEGLDVRARYFELLRTQHWRALEFDPFSSATIAYRPYRQLDLSVAQALGEVAEVAVGYDLRRLADRSAEAAFNREFDRAYATLAIDGVGGMDFGGDVTAEHWDSSGEDVFAIDASVRAALSAQWRATVGTAYWHYKMDHLRGREQERVRAYFLRFDGRLGDRLRFDLDYSYEDGEFDRYHSLRGGLTWQF